MTSPRSPAEPLTFKALDGLALALRHNRLHRYAGKTFCFEDIGPWMELQRLQAAGLTSDAGPTFVASGNSQLARLLHANGRVSAAPSQNSFLVRPEQATLDTETLVPLALAAQANAATCGIPKTSMLRITSALGEMFDNVFEHSEAPTTGIAAFCITASSFEFVVADDGIGVLASLRRSPDHAGLADEGDALAQAIRPNVSRFPSELGRGHGFDRLVTGMANMNAELRFRSGDAVLQLSGVGQAQPQPTVSQTVAIPGFVITAKFHALRRS